MPTEWQKSGSTVCTSRKAVTFAQSVLRGPVLGRFRRNDRILASCEVALEHTRQLFAITAAAQREALLQNIACCKHVLVRCTLAPKAASSRIRGCKNRVKKDPDQSPVC